MALPVLGFEEEHAKAAILLASLAAALVSAAATAALQAARPDLTDTLEREVPRLMKLSAVPGLMLALVEDGRVAWAGAFGARTWSRW